MRDSLGGGGRRQSEASQQTGHQNGSDLVNLWSYSKEPLARPLLLRLQEKPDLREFSLLCFSGIQYLFCATRLFCIRVVDCKLVITVEQCPIIVCTVSGPQIYGRSAIEEESH